MAAAPYKLFAPDWKHGHSKNDALSLALFAELAYEKNLQKVRKVLKDDWKFTRVERSAIKKGVDIDTSATIACNDEILMIAFRGSYSRSNWLANFQVGFDPGPLKDTRVHQGFQDSIFPALLDIAMKAQSMLTNKQQIWITGHSLGGALAVLMAAMLEERNIRVAGLYTFAAPRVGNHKFQKALDARMAGQPHFRYVNEHDIVPQLPPEPLYTHAGERRIITAKKKVTKSSSTWVRIKKAFAAWYNELTDGDIQLKEYHLLNSKDGYIPALVKAAGK